MIRNTIVLFLFGFGAFFVGLYLAYAEIDPCRALAVEKARRSSAPTARRSVDVDHHRPHEPIPMHPRADLFLA